MTFRNTTCLLVTAACVASPSSPPSIKFDFSLPPPLLFAHASSSPQLTIPIPPQLPPKYSPRA
ncbi:hypothetical protein C8R43DRAFT_1131599 [Mycena crocata]|nr:hypothetical protein C8R43DRAFT_1131599 [Mycena crocata]